MYTGQNTEKQLCRDKRESGGAIAQPPCGFLWVEEYVAVLESSAKIIHMVQLQQGESPEKTVTSGHKLPVCGRMWFMSM